MADLSNMEIQPIKDDSINEKVVDIMKEIVDRIESLIDCSGGYLLNIGEVYIEGQECDLYLQFGYSSYFYALDKKPITASKSCNLNSKYMRGLYLENFNFRLMNYEELYENIIDKVKEIIDNHNHNIQNKKDFYERILLEKNK